MAAGCAEEYQLGQKGTADAPISNCSAQTDCGEGQICEQGLCTVAQGPQTTISLHLVPPSSSGVLPQQWLDVTVGSGRRVPAISLRPTMTLSGTIRSDNLLAASIPAQVVATARSIPGTVLKQSAMAIDGGGFTLTLVQGVTYDLTVYPTSDQLPPLTVADITLHGDAVEHIRLPGASEYGSLRGRVVFQEGDSQGVAGVRAQAFGEDPARVSTWMVTGEDGRFRLVLPPGRSRYTLRLSPTVPDNPLLPTVDTTGLLVDGELELGDVALGGGDVPALQVQGLIVDEEGWRVTSGADIEFSAPIGRGTYVSPAIGVDLTGEFQVSLLPGEYTVRIVPAPASSYAVTFFSCTILQASALEPFVLRSKAVLTGRVLDPHGELPVPGVQVEALLVGNGGMGGLYRIGREVTDQSGTFRLQLDPGVFDVTLIPIPASGMPRWIERGIRPESSPLHEFQLPEPRVIHGMLLRQDGSAAREVQVSAYARRERGAATLLGTGQTDGDGAYVIVLPHQP